MVGAQHVDGYEDDVRRSSERGGDNRWRLDPVGSADVDAEASREDPVRYEREYDQHRERRDHGQPSALGGVAISRSRAHALRDDEGRDGEHDHRRARTQARGSADVSDRVGERPQERMSERDTDHEHARVEAARVDPDRRRCSEERHCELERHHAHRRQQCTDRRQQGDGRDPLETSGEDQVGVLGGEKH